MRKWKVLLVMLCAMLVSVGLFACKGGDDDNQGDNNGDDPNVEQPVSAEEIDRVTNVRGIDNLKFKDSDTWTEVLAELESKARVECRTGNRETITVNGTDCDFVHTLEFDEAGHCKVGNYTVKAKPKQNNPKNAVSAAKNISITHDFGAADAKGVETCSYCLATRTYAEENSIIHYGTFHEGTNMDVPAAVRNTTLNASGELEEKPDGTNGSVFTNKNTGKSYIEDFGSVTVGGKSVKVPTLTVGRLEQGMTITVKGKALTTWEKWNVAENAYYYFPVIGIADRYSNAPVWEGKATETGSYTGGTSVFVRGEGWVLYNGIGNATENSRPLAALGAQANGSFVDGTSEDRNYGSHSNAELGDGEKRPSSFTPGQIPNVNDWVDWVVYSTGNTSNSGDSYTSLTEIELTWNYRQDGIIELIYVVNGSKLTCMVKVPDSSTGYYDTILHGDYVDMWIESYERIETLTPTDFSASVNGDNLYYAGQTFDPATISASFTYKQLSGARPQTLSLENVYATGQNVTIEEITDPKNPSDFVKNESNWVSMTTNPVSGDYTYYMVKISKGGETWYAVFDAKEINVIANKIESVYGSDVGADIKNNNMVGELAIGTDGSKITLTPVGAVYAQSIGAEVAKYFAVGGTSATGANHRYVALAIKGSDLGEITSCNVPYYYDRTNGYLVLALTAETKVVTVAGLNAVATEFDFSAAQGFKVSGTIELANDASSWYLNNDENKVTVTFTPNANETWGRIYIGDQMFNNPTHLISGKNMTFNGFKFVADETVYDAETGALTIAVKFPAANLMSYSARSIRATVSGTIDLEYKIDYLPRFADNKTFDGDAGYFTFLSGGKIYLAKIAADATADNALTLNLNAGDDNVALLNLAYAYNAATDSVILKNSANLTGVAVDVLKNVAGKDIILLEIDPSEYGIEGAAYGYQLKTTAYSGSYFAVSGGAVDKKAVSTTKSLILNEGSCLEKGLSGYVNNSGEAMFIASPAEFAGAHSNNIAASGNVCQYCGEAAHRSAFAEVGTITLHDNEFVELGGSFNASGFAQVYNGITLKLTAGSDWYWIRNDGYIGYNDYGVAAEGENVWSSLGDVRTPNGKIDSEGNAITDQRYKDTMKEGAGFRVWAGYRDGTLTTTWRVYKKSASNGVSIYGGVYFEFTHKFDFTADSLNALTLTFGRDDASIGNIWWFNGTIDKNAITGAADAVSGGNIVFEVGNIENHFATVSATGGNAATLDAAVKNELGIADAEDADDYTKYVKLDIALGGAYTTGNAVATVYDASMNLRAGAKAEFNTAKTELTVTVALGKGNKAPGKYYIVLKNSDGSTKQANIELDLSAVSLFGTKSTVDTDGAALIKGGSVVITYEDLTGVDLTSARISLNGTSKGLDDLDFGGGLTAVWSAEGNNGTLTLAIPETARLTGIPSYAVALIDSEGTTVVTNVFQIMKKPAEDGNVFAVNENIYGLATGDKLYLYLFGDAATGTDYFVFNANNSNTDKTAILPYSLAFSISGNNVSFKDTNALITGEKVTANYFVSGANKITQFEIDLSYFKIAASGDNAAYLFEVLTADIEDSAVYYTVAAADRAVDKIEVCSLPAEKADVSAVTCYVDGTVGYEATDWGYYGIELIEHGHVFPEEGGLCSRCKQITGWVKEDIQVGKADNSTTWKFEHGTDKAYNPANLTDRYSAILPGQTVVAEGTLTTAVTTNNWNGIAALLYPADKFNDGDHLRIDSWINNGGNPNVNPIHDLTFAKANSNNFDAMRSLRQNAHLTITWDWSNTVQIVVTIKVEGISQKGTFWCSYTFTPVTGKSFAPQYSIGIGPDLGCFKGTLTATAPKDVVPADKCNPVKHEHEYDIENADKCWCGDQNPNHVHQFTKNGYCAANDGAVCPHANVTGGVCEDCDAAITSTDSTIATVVVGFDATGTALGTIDKSTETQYNTIAFEATYGTCKEWGGLLFLLKDGENVLYRFRYIDGAYTAPGAGWNTAQNGNAISHTGTAVQATDRTNLTVKALITFDKNGVMVIRVEHWSETSMTEWREFTISGLAKDSYTIAVNMDNNGSSVVSGSASATSTTATWTAATPEE